jgi:hypothetical protein
MYTNEIWLPVKGFEGIYSVSNMGRLRTEAHEIVRKDGLKRYLQTKVKEVRHQSLTVSLSKDNKPHYTYIHRLVAQAFVPNPHNYRFVEHISGNHLDNAAENLRWVKRTV